MCRDVENKRSPNDLSVAAMRKSRATHVAAQLATSTPGPARTTPAPNEVAPSTNHARPSASASAPPTYMRLLAGRAEVSQQEDAHPRERRARNDVHKITALLREGILREIKGFRARDVLVGVVAKVLRDLGFEVRVDYPARARDGATREVDVWAWKVVEGVPFRVYVSCKNLDREVGAPIVDQEAGRVSQLLETPNIKFIVASRFNENGRKAAVADSFIPIEIGFKVDESNAIEAYERVYSVMNTVFTAIAPKKFQQLAETVAKIANELKRVGEELSKLVK